MFIKVNVQMREKGIKELKGAPLAVYLAYALHMNWEGIAFPSLDTLVKETGYTRRNIRMALRKLEEWGYIEPLKLSTRSTAYRLNHYVAMGRKAQFEREATNYTGEEISNNQDVSNFPLSRNNEVDKEDVNKDISSSSRSSLEEISNKKDVSNFPPVSNAREIWDKVKEEVKKEVTSLNYKTWVKDTKGLGFLDGAIVVGVPSDFIGEWLERLFQPLLVKKTSEVLGSRTEVKIMKSQED